MELHAGSAARELSTADKLALMLEGELGPKSRQTSLSGIRGQVVEKFMPEFRSSPETYFDKFLISNRNNHELIDRVWTHYLALKLTS